MNNNTDTAAARFEIDHLTVGALQNLQRGQTGLGFLSAGGYYDVTRNEDGLIVIELEDVASFVVLPSEIQAKADQPIDRLVAARLSDWQRRNA